MMKLFYTPLSPYARKCRIIIIEKGMEGRVELVHTPPVDSPPELLAANPLARVPALVTDDGQHFCESPVICEYLDMLVPKPQIIPTSGKARFDALALSALAHGIMDSSVSCVLEGRRPDEKQYRPWIERKEAAIVRSLEMMASQLPSENSFDIGTISAVVALDYISIRQPHINWRGDHPAMAAWHAAQSSRPSFTTTAPVL
jgi:glutathione S-transferase